MFIHAMNIHRTYIFKPHCILSKPHCPTISKKEKEKRSKVSKSMQQFKYCPTGLSSYSIGQFRLEQFAIKLSKCKEKKNELHTLFLMFALVYTYRNFCFVSLTLPATETMRKISLISRIFTLEREKIVIRIVHYLWH